jgi:hypothetical protein
MPIHPVRTLEQALKVIVPDDERDAQADRAPQGVPAADPVPELEHVLLRDPKLGHGGGVGRERDKVLGDVLLRGVGCGEEPLLGGLGVGDRLLGRERLGGDDEERRFGVADFERLGDVRAVDVGYEVGREVALGVGLQRLGDHHGSQVRSTDANVDDGVDSLARVALPLPAPHLLREILDVRQHAPDLVNAALLDLELPVQVPQRDVQHGTVLGRVDVLAGEHLVPVLLHLGLAREGEQGGEHGGRDEVFAVVEQEGDVRAGGGGVLPGEGGEAGGVGREEVLEDQLGFFGGVDFLQFLPCGVF